MNDDHTTFDSSDWFERPEVVETDTFERSPSGFPSAVAELLQRLAAAAPTEVTLPTLEDTDRTADRLLAWAVVASELAGLLKEDPSRRRILYGIREGETEEAFVERRSANPIGSWAVLAEGVWRERGQMGWWGMSDATPQSEADFDHWLANFLVAAAESPAWIAVVDVHI